MTRTKWLGACGVALLIPSLAILAHAQTDQVKDRFTFVAANASKGGPSAEGRLEIVVNRWSSDVERDRVLSVVTEEGPAKLFNALRDANMTGWINWPGHLHYTLRYARRTPRPNGGDDVVLVADSRAWVWWDPALSTGSTDAPYTVIHLRLNKEGAGDGNVSFGTKIRGDKAAGIVLEGDATQPTLLTEVRRERSAS
jgi:hypothetical protein